MFRTQLLVTTILAALALASTARATPPTISSVAQQERHVAMTFSAPNAKDVAVDFATAPDRGSNGRFLEEHYVKTAHLTDEEIAAGRWFDDEQTDPGAYFVMLRVDRDRSRCDTRDEHYTTVVDPACADGLSSVVPLTVPRPSIRYTIASEPLPLYDELRLTLTADPLGDDLPYAICWWQRGPGRRSSLRRRCVNRTMHGFYWTQSSVDTLTVSVKRMRRRTRFTWYSRGPHPVVLTSRTITVR